MTQYNYPLKPGDPDPRDLQPKEFAKICGILIGVFFALLITTSIFSCLGSKGPPKVLCVISCLYFISSTIYIMVGMIQSFEIARKRFDRLN